MNAVEFKDRVLIESGDPTLPVLSAKCENTVYRPGPQEGSVAKDSNKFFVSFRKAPKAMGPSLGRLVFWLKGLPVEMWGNRFDRYPFSVLEPFSDLFFFGSL